MRRPSTRCLEVRKTAQKRPIETLPLEQKFIEPGGDKLLPALIVEKNAVGIKLDIYVAAFKMPDDGGQLCV